MAFFFITGKDSFHTSETGCYGSSKSNSGAGIKNSNGGGRAFSGQRVNKQSNFRDLVIYTQKDIFSLQPGQKLPTIINPGIDPFDGLSELVEGRDYNPDDYVQVAGHDLFDNGGNLYLLGEFKLLILCRIM